MSNIFLLSKTKLFSQKLQIIPIQKLLINTLNAHCYNITQTDAFYREALLNSDVLIPDGISVVWAYICLPRQKIQKNWKQLIG